LERLFKKSSISYVRERAALEKNGYRDLPHLENYLLFVFRREHTVGSARRILGELFEKGEVEFAYFEPIATNAVTQQRHPHKKKAPLTLAPTPDFMSKQFHLEAAPTGVDAKFAWTFPGGDGKGLKVIDVEFGWNSSHEDFNEPFFEKNGSSYVDHGTAVWGEVAAVKDDKGMSGIAYGVEFGVVASEVAARAYELAASKLDPGNVMIIEQHAPGPDSGKYTAMEYWQANFDALKIITAKGIHVVAAAGNGNSNFDSRAYNGAFDLKIRDSGAILVGAGGPPTGSSHLKRLSFSNYGSRIDAFGYGGSVVTTGYGDLFNGGYNRTYTDSFSGTSSATPIVAGSVLSLLGMANAKSLALTPKEVRTLLRETGTAQLGDTSQRIGNLPNLKQLAERIFPN
ncbi:MAG: S8 family serine peptidase, partial [Deltaproteobacteria bacterium]|nr:S8 family serine peptidase [Deltaproteobacteria bacterium]